jgi:uncharacterized membrane protein YphA (DoxX/SURF4 family)
MASSDASPAFISLGIVFAMAGLGVLIGFFTPVSCLLTALITGGTAVSLFPRPNPDFIGSGLPAILTSCVAIALVFLGPGALSLDAKRFGRREIEIPISQSRPPES